MPRKPHKYHYLYKTTNLINNKFYIGLHSTNDLEDGYLGSGKYLRNSIYYHGKENFKRDILEFFENRELLKEKEKNIVNEDLLKNPLCMNLHIGGAGVYQGNYGSKRTPEQCKRISDSLIGKPLSKSRIEKMRLSKLGKKASDETKSKMSIARKGKPMSEETKIKLRKPKSETHKQNMQGPKEKTTCNICGFTGGISAMTKYHFGNCKKQIILGIAKTYRGTNFAIDYKKEYSTAHSSEYLDELNHVLGKPKRIKHSKERTLAIFLNYIGKNFRKDYNSEYTHARVNNYLNELKT